MCPLRCWCVWVYVYLWMCICAVMWCVCVCVCVCVCARARIWARDKCEIYIHDHCVSLLMCPNHMTLRLLMREEDQSTDKATHCIASLIKCSHIIFNQNLNMQNMLPNHYFCSAFSLPFTCTHMTYISSIVKYAHIYTEREIKNNKFE